MDPLYSLSCAHCDAEAETPAPRPPAEQAETFGQAVAEAAALRARNAEADTETITFPQYVAEGEPGQPIHTYHLRPLADPLGGACAPQCSAFGACSGDDDVDDLQCCCSCGTEDGSDGCGG